MAVASAPCVTSRRAIRRAKRERRVRRRRHDKRVDLGEHPLARQHEAGARQTQNMTDRR